MLDVSTSNRLDVQRLPIRRRRRAIRQQPHIQLPQILVDAFAGDLVPERLEQLSRPLQVGTCLVTIAHGGAKPRVFAVYVGLEPACRLTAATQLDGLFEEYETVLVALAAPQFSHAHVDPRHPAGLLTGAR